MAEFKSGVSVIVCCYNSAARLSETLKHLALQVIPKKIFWEVILVDNVSNDNTVEVAQAESKAYKELTGKFHIVYENTPGLSYARQKGASKARYKYLIFCDDDNWLDQNYLYNSFQIMESDPQIGALGGIGSAITNDTKFPDWFESVKNGYAVGPQSQYQGDVSKTCTLWGAGLVTRTNLFLKCFDLKYPSLVTDRIANTLSSGGDDEICLRMLLKGYKLYYNEKLTFVHFIPKERCTKEYFEKLFVNNQKNTSMLRELNNYTLLYRLNCVNSFLKPIIVGKIFLGFLSTVFLSRRSWSITDSINVFYFYTRIDMGVSRNTKMVYDFYKFHSVD